MDKQRDGKEASEMGEGDGLLFARVVRQCVEQNVQVAFRHKQQMGICLLSWDPMCPGTTFIDVWYEVVWKALL